VSKKGALQAGAALGEMYGPEHAESLLKAYGDAQYQGTLPVEQRDEDYQTNPEYVMEYPLREAVYKHKNSVDTEEKFFINQQMLDLDRR